MKKAYKTPVARAIKLFGECPLLSGSKGGLNDDDEVGNQKPIDDDDDNFFSHRRTTIWDNTEW